MCLRDSRASGVPKGVFSKAKPVVAMFGSCATSINGKWLSDGCFEDCWLRIQQIHVVLQVVASSRLSLGLPRVQEKVR